MTILTTDSTHNIFIIKTLSKNYFAGNKVMQDLTVVQAILESNLDHSPPSLLALKYNNLFGQKPSRTIPELLKGTNGIVKLMTHEYVRGENTPTLAGFLSNNNIEDSLEQRETLFNKLARYDNLFDAKTFEEAATLVRQDGYATDPQYTQELIRVYNLYVRD